MRSTVASAIVATALPLVSATNSPDGTFVMPLKRIKGTVAYGFELDVGTPPQKNIVFVDSGSPTTGLEDPNSSACRQGSCKDYGSYDNTTSSSAVWVNNNYFDHVIDRGAGALINETLRFGGPDGRVAESITVGRLSQFSGGSQASAQAGIFGLGALCFHPECRDYPTTVQQLADRGLISHRVFSIYLGPNNLNATGQLVLGGVDRAKRDGPVHTARMRPDQSGQPNHIQVLNAALRDADGSTVASYSLPADQQNDPLLDSGTARWDLPTPVFTAVMAKLGNADLRPLKYGYEADCKLRGPDSKEVIVATLEGNVDVEVPLSRVVGEFDGTRCITYVSNGGTGSGGLGDEFMRSIYATFDYDARTIHYSKAKYTDETDIVAV